jgi:hypothetical protein
MEVLLELHQQNAALHTPTQGTQGGGAFFYAVPEPAQDAQVTAPQGRC